MAITTDEPRTLVPAQAFVRTYSNPVYNDPWEAVEDYEQVQSIAHEYENPSSTAIADYLTLPRGRVKPWLGDTKPDCVRGLEAARQHGWIGVDTDSRVFRGLNVLLAWIYSGGSISKDTYTPYFVVDDEADEAILHEAGELANVVLDFTRSAQSARAVELRPTRDGSVLGRVLSVLQAPVGEKNEASVTGLPDYLAGVDESLAREFVQTYVHNRGQHRENTDFIRFREQRSDRYLRSVARLIRRLTGERVTVSDRNVYISAKAGRAMALWEPLLDFNI